MKFKEKKSLNLLPKAKEFCPTTSDIGMKYHCHRILTGKTFSIKLGTNQMSLPVKFIGELNRKFE